MIAAAQTPIPSNGSAVTVLTGQPLNGLSISIRNTGTVNVLLGGPDGNLVFPLQPNEYIGVVLSPEDTLQAKVQTAGTAGQITTLSS